MSSTHEYGTEVEVDETRAVLEPTRQLRLALDVLWEKLPADLETEVIQKTLWQIHEWICAAELSALQTYGLNRQYTIIRPLNMTSLPDSESMQKITSAIRALADLGLIAGPGEV